MVIGDEVLRPTSWATAPQSGASSVSVTARQGAPSGTSVYRWTWKADLPGMAKWGIPAPDGTYDFTPYLNKSVVGFQAMGKDASTTVAFRLVDSNGQWLEWRTDELQPPLVMSEGKWSAATIPLRATDFASAGVDASRIQDVVFEAVCRPGEGELFIDAVHVIPASSAGVNNGSKAPLSRRAAESGGASQQNAASASATGNLLVDDFSARDLDHNALGGKWGAFSAGDKGDVQVRIIDDSDGQPAIEAAGVLPVFPGGVTWGGVVCDLDAKRMPRDLSAYKALQFRVRSDSPAMYEVRIENPTDTHKSTNVPFKPTRGFTQITIPLKEFASGVKESTIITWKLQDEKAGARFNLVLDDIMFVK